MEAITEEELRFESNHYSYRIFYRGQEVGKQEASSHTKPTPANFHFQEEMAKIKIKEIVSGNIPAHIRRMIVAVQELQTT